MNTPPRASYSLVGRPRRATDAQIEEILDWHRNRTTMKQLAARLGLSINIVAAVIRSNGTHYKQPSPEQRAAILARSRRKRAGLERAYLIA